MTLRIGRVPGILTLLIAGLLATACSAPAAEPAAEPEPSASASEAEPASACPDHVPGDHEGTAEDPYGPGDEIAIGCFTVVVDEVVIDATDAVMAANPDAAPAEGNVFMTATLTITRNSDGPGDVSEVEVRLGGSMSTSGEPEEGVTVDPPQPTGTLDEGATVTGTYVFEMSGGASTSVELRVGQMEPVSVLPY